MKLLECQTDIFDRYMIRHRGESSSWKRSWRTSQDDFGDQTLINNERSTVSFIYITSSYILDTFSVQMYEYVWMALGFQH